MLKALWRSLREVVDPMLPETPDARFVFRHRTQAMGSGNTRMSVVDQAYRVDEGRHRAEGTLGSDELDGFIRELEVHEVWALDAMVDAGSAQPTCQPWHTITIRHGDRRHRVQFTLLANARATRFAQWLSQSIVMRHAQKLDAHETIDPTLMCTGCSAQHAAGSTTCRNDGNGLIRVGLAAGEFSGFRCASCNAKIPLMLAYVRACAACGAAMTARK